MSDSADIDHMTGLEIIEIRLLEEYSDRLLYWAFVTWIGLTWPDALLD